MLFISIILLGCIVTLVLGLHKKFALINPKKYLLKASIIALVISIIAGISAGTIYTHAFDIYWWFFSIFCFIIILLITLILVGITRIILLIKKENENSI